MTITIVRWCGWYLGEVWIRRSCLFGGRLDLSRPWHLHRDTCYPRFYGVHGLFGLPGPGPISRAGRLLESMSSSWRRCSVSETDLIRDSQRHRHRPSWKPFQMLLQRKISWPPITRWSFLLALCLHFPTTGQTVGMSCRCHVKCSLSRSLGLAHGQVPSLRKHLLRIHTPGYFGP